MAETEKSAPDRSGVQVIARAAAVLRALEGHGEGLSLAEIATRLGLARSTVQRIVKALSDEQLLVPTSSRGGVRLGPLLVRLAQGAAVDVASLVRPQMEQLCRELSETVDLSVRQGAEALFLAQVVGPQRLATVTPKGAVFPLHNTAAGKALLASLAPDELRTVLRGSLRRDTARTVTNSDLVEAEIAQVRVSRTAIDRDEHTTGISAIGTWFEDVTGISYALSVPVPTVRFGDGARLVEPLLRTAEAIARIVGVRR